VLPPEADISAGRISVLTPIGAALIGLSPGQSIDWETRDGRVGRLTVESVEAATTALRRAS
jgi:regulator of nucleoside diphosphate kinase